MFQNQADQDMYLNFVLSSKLLSQNECHTEGKFQPFVLQTEPYYDFQNCKNIFPLKLIKNNAVLKMLQKCLMLKRRQKQKSGCVFQIRMQLFVIELAV